MAPPPCFRCLPQCLLFLLLPHDYLVPEPRIGIATLGASSTLLVSPAGSTCFFPHMLFPEPPTGTTALFPFRHQPHSGSAYPRSLHNLRPLHLLHNNSSHFFTSTSSHTFLDFIFTAVALGSAYCIHCLRSLPPLDIPQHLAPSWRRLPAARDRPALRVRPPCP